MYVEKRGWELVDDLALERKFCIAAIPLMLGIAVLFKISGLGSSLQRIFLTMPVHELGHAISGWLCGYAAIPSLWKTIIPDSRGFVAPLMLLISILYMMRYAMREHSNSLFFLGLLLLILQTIGTLALSEGTADWVVTFGGDGMGMILATVLMCTFFFGKGSQLYRGWLRWGFLMIGAAAFIDIYGTWWIARDDVYNIPYGETGGIKTDAWKLINFHFWSREQLVGNYLSVGLACLISLATVYAWGVWRVSVALRTRRQRDNEN